MKYTKKPVTIEATQWFKNGDHPKDYAGGTTGYEQGELKSWDEKYMIDNDWEGKVVRRYRTPDVDGQTQCKHCGEIMHIHGWIETLEGGHIVCPGDWIITGVKGENYPCKPDVFAMTYKQAAQAQAAVEPADRIPDAGETMPVVYIRRDQLQKAQTQALLCEVTPEARQDRIAIYTSPPDALKFRPDWSGVEVLAEELREAQEVMRLALEALHNSLPVGTDPVAICARHDAAIAALEELASHLTD
jgi:hypothetical protein